MKRFEIWCFLFSICTVCETSRGGAPLIDPPTPPPCAADGICYPNTGKWGFYQARWRTWPGAKLEPTAKSPTEAGRISEELGPAETPPAEMEDAAAPPSSARPREEGSEKTPGEKPPAAAPGGESTLPNVPLPDAEKASPLGPTGEHDPPPTLPRSLTGTSRSQGQGRAPSLQLRRPANARVSTNDPPPAPPWAQSASL
ncbi:MAG: hypothetical protein AB7G28_18115 [Pirellulales bacterium]